MSYVRPQQGIHGGCAIELQLANPYRQNTSALFKFPHNSVNFLIDLFAFPIFDSLISDGVLYVPVNVLLAKGVLHRFRLSIRTLHEETKTSFADTIELEL